MGGLYGGVNVRPRHAWGIIHPPDGLGVAMDDVQTNKGGKEEKFGFHK